ncbi:MAG: uL15 family ribosomal protein [Nanoarchaeota archaeon]
MATGKKTNKNRGSHTHGYGMKKKHRGAGSRGGVGFAGSSKHMKLYVKKHFPEHFEKKKFKSLTQKGFRKDLKSINITHLITLSEGKKEIDLATMGYHKLLGKGVINTPLQVTAKLFSKLAKEKIEKAGGKAIAG